MKGLLFSLLLLASGLAGAVEWKNVDAAHHLGGRKASAGYLQGKVVLVCRWRPGDASARETLGRLEEIWQSFKMKPFVILAGSCDDLGTAEDAKKVVTASGISFPAYSGAALAVGEPGFTMTPLLYVVDETGKVIYLGKKDRNVTMAVVSALTDLEAPRNLKQLKRFLDFELETLPGRAYLRANEFRKSHPDEAKAYYEKFKALTSIPDVKQLSQLVDFARRAKDMREFGVQDEAKKQKFAKLLESAILKYAPLAEAADPRVAQEAKNALADLKWTQAAL